LSFFFKTYVSKKNINDKHVLIIILFLGYVCHICASTKSQHVSRCWIFLMIILKSNLSIFKYKK
jgi:hypothetical protein